MSIMNPLGSDGILIIDFGSQYTQLIARRIRELGVYCEIYPYSISIEQIEKFSPHGIILSGGPETVPRLLPLELAPVYIALASQFLVSVTECRRWLLNSAVR